VAGFQLRVGTTLDTFWDWALGKSGAPLAVVFVQDDGPRSVATADAVGRSRPGAPRLIVSWKNLDEKRFRDVREFIALDSKRPLRDLTRLRRELLRRRVEQVVLELTSDDPASGLCLAAAFAGCKLLVFNEDGESQPIDWREPVRAWRFLRGASASDASRPTGFAVVREWLRWLGVARLVSGQMVRRGVFRRRPFAISTARSGCAVLCLPNSEPAALDRHVTESEAAELVVALEPRLPGSATISALRRRLQQPDVWLVCGRAAFKYVLGEGWAPHRPGESGTFCLGASSSLFAFRRDVFLELGGWAAFEKQLPGQGWSALSLRAWLRGYRTIYAGDIDTRSVKPAAAPPHPVEGPPLASLLPACDSLTAAARLLHRHARNANFRNAYRAAVRRLRLPAAKGKPGPRLTPLAEPGSVIFEGREPGRPIRLAILAPDFPYPSGAMARMYHLLHRIAEHCDLFLFCYTPKAPDAQLEALLSYCARLVMIQPRPESLPGLTGALPPGVSRFDTRVMQRHLEILLDDWQIPLLEVEGTELAMAAAWLEHASVVKLLAAPELRSIRDSQIREGQRPTLAKRLRRETAAWRRYELRHLRRFECIVTTAEPDRERLSKALSGPVLRTVEDGVDTEHFRSSGPDPAEDSVLFIGELEDFVNVQALESLLLEIWPRILDARPRAELTVAAGAEHRLHWRRRFRRALPQIPQVTVLGHVGDLRPLYERASVVIAPQAAGNRVRARLLEALAMGRAVVATRAACEGLATEPGRDLLVEAEPAAFAAAVVKLLSDDGLRRRQGQQGHSYVESRHDWDRSAAQQLAVYEELLRNKR
jgi:glycosyltransferase involved in cell wall biosynthesis